MAMAEICGATSDELRNSMKSFSGAERRFDFHIKEENLVLLSDYAHHPDEIKACAESMRALYNDKKITVIFQPHLYSRTSDFYKEFAESLSMFDEVILLDIYPARELPIPGVSSQLIYDLLDEKVAKRMCTRKDVPEIVKEIKDRVEVLVTLGAGDLDNDVPQIAKILKNVTW
jgi:UDP-N-acetylmuramate--alanine ligase